MPTPTRRNVRALPRSAGIAVVVGGLLLAQAGFYASGQLDALNENLVLRELTFTARPAPAGDHPLATFNELESLQALIPADARVLLVSGATRPGAYEFSLLPRPLHLLFAVDKLAADAAQLPPRAAGLIRSWIAQLEAAGERLDAASLREQLAAADCLVTVLAEVETLPWPAGAPAPQLLGRAGVTAVYRLGAPR